MDSANNPGDVAKKTLTRLAKERLTPTAENYCVTFRKVRADEEPWSSYCHYTGQLQEALREMLRPWLSPNAALESETAKLVRELDGDTASATKDADLVRIRNSAEAIGSRLRRHLVGAAEVQAELLAVLQLLMGGIANFGEQGQWLHEHLKQLDELVSKPLAALNLRRARKVLREIIDKQAEFGNAMGEAQQTLKAVMSELVQQAAALARNTAGYEQKVGELSVRVQAANDLTAIRTVVSDLGSFVHSMGDSIRSSHAEMSATHERLVHAERQIQDLRQSLAETSEQARRDRLTGALNRTGLEDIWQREVEAAKATGLPLSLGLLDVDNFKLLNDSHGHQVGDEALVHLSSVIRNALHGTDTMARYGGEEFVVLLPDTDANGAEAVMRRLQRELTKHFFLHHNERVLITFSAGVSLVKPGDDSIVSAIERADAALYRAKHQGKNRVAIG
jgi:diguanylate cyclase